MEIQSILKRYKYSKSKIKTFMKLYKYAIENNIIYPLYYATVKTNN